MKKILFVCHGNICRSPMAEFIMKDLLEKEGLIYSFLVESAATSMEELGNPVYPPARKMLLSHGIDPSGKRARRINQGDYSRFDLLIGMDNANIRNMLYLFGNDPDGKIHRLMDFSSRPGEVSDPWYTDDFQTAYVDILEGCQGLLKSLKIDGFPPKK